MKKPYNNYGGGFERKQTFKATCAKCGETCSVPFKPNGRKPVYCSNCFIKEDGGESRSFGGRSGKPAFRSDRGGSSPRFFEDSNSEGLQKQLKEINDKLDAIIEALEN